MTNRRADGNWEWLKTGPGPDPRPCLFLDRDGVLIEERNYLKDPALVDIIPGAPETIRAARALGWAVAVVTNQSGIARGLISWDEYEAVEHRVHELLAAENAGVDMVLACPYVAEGGRPPYDRDDIWRKPGPGMLLEAARALNVDLGRSIMVGDRSTDLIAGERAGVAAVVHVLTGYGAKERETIAARMRPKTRLQLVDNVGDVLKKL